MQDIITSALLTNNKQQQEAAQKQLYSILSSSPELYCTQCCSITHDDSLEELLRQSAGTLLASAILIKPTDSTSYTYWDTIPRSTKEQIKSSMLHTLVSNSELVKRSAANVIAAVASLEIPKGEWNGLIATLVNIIGGDNLSLVQTAIVTLGFTSQALAKGNIKVDIQRSEEILTGIVLGFKAAETHNNLQIRRTALSALRDSLNFLVDVLEKRECREYIFRSITQNLATPETVQLAIQTLSQYCRYGYNYLGESILEINQALKNIIIRGETNAVSAIEIWNSIGSEYIDRKQRLTRIHSNSIGDNYLLPIHEDLSMLFLQSMVANTDDPQLKSAAANAFTTLVTACGPVTFPMATNFISNIITSTQEHIRQATVFAFSALTETEEKETIIGFFSAALPNFLNLLADPSTVVLISTLEGFSRIFQQTEFSDTFTKRNDLEANINILVSLTTHKNSEVVKGALMALNSFFEKFHPEMNESSDKMLPLVFKTLIDNCLDRRDSLVDFYFRCIISLLKNNRNYELTHNFLDYVLKRIEKLDLSEPITSGGMSILAVGIRGMPSVRLNQDFMDKIFNFVLRYFERNKSLNSDGLAVIGSLAFTYKKLFNKHMKTSWPYIMTGLRSSSDLSVYKGSLFCISDLAIGLSHFFIPYFNDVIGYLVEGISSNIDREIKIFIFDTISDIVGAVGMEAEPYIPEILRIVDIGIHAAVLIVDDHEYIEELRGSLVRLESDLLYSVNDMDSPNQHTQDHFPRLLQFMLVTNRKEENPTIEYLKNSVELCYHSAVMYNCLERLRVQEYQEMLDQLGHFTAVEHNLEEMLMIIRRQLNSPL